MKLSQVELYDLQKTFRTALESAYKTEAKLRSQKVYLEEQLKSVIQKLSEKGAVSKVLEDPSYSEIELSFKELILNELENSGSSSAYKTKSSGQKRTRSRKDPKTRVLELLEKLGKIDSIPVPELKKRLGISNPNQLLKTLGLRDCVAKGPTAKAASTLDLKKVRKLFDKMSA